MTASQDVACDHLELRLWWRGIETGAHLRDILLGRAADELIEALVVYARRLEFSALGSRDVSQAALVRLAALEGEVRRLARAHHQVLEELRAARSASRGAA